MIYEILQIIIAVLLLWVGLGILIYPVLYEKRWIRILFWFPWGLFDR